MTRSRKAAAPATRLASSAPIADDIMQVKVWFARRQSGGVAEETRWRLENALDRTRARERAKGTPFSRRDVADRLRKGEHLEFMHHQHY